MKKSFDNTDEVVCGNCGKIFKQGKVNSLSDAIQKVAPSCSFECRKNQKRLSW